MTEVIKNCYCDVLSEHDGQKVAGASTCKDVKVMATDGDGKYTLTTVQLDMCPACREKYSVNLFVSYDYKRRATYSFATTSTQ